MTILLVGADQLGNIPKELEKHGCKEIIHWSGRKNKMKLKVIPEKVDMVVVFRDFVNHCQMHSIKDQAKSRNMPVVFSRRAIADLKQGLTRQEGDNFF